MQFYYNGSPTLYTITVPDGYYTLQQLIDTLHILFETATGDVGTLNLSIVNYKIYFEIKATKTMRFIIYTNSQTPLNDLYLSLGLVFT